MNKNLTKILGKDNLQAQRVSLSRKGTINLINPIDANNKQDGIKTDQVENSFSESSKQSEQASFQEMNRQPPEVNDELPNEKVQSNQSGSGQKDQKDPKKPGASKMNESTSLKLMKSPMKRDSIQYDSSSLRKNIKGTTQTANPASGTGTNSSGLSPSPNKAPNQLRLNPPGPTGVNTRPTIPLLKQQGSNGSESANANSPNKPSSTALANAVVAFAKDFATNKVRSSNVKVVARFRPLSQMEKELAAVGVGTECVSFPNEREVSIMPENQTFTFDRVFQMNTNQPEIYEFIGRETIEDVLSGYNGTIFAYGQTGSGKTHTMYGNIHDLDLRGVIPRASDHIFEYIENMKLEVDLYIKCSMLEIYKENLYDLLIGYEGDEIGDRPRDLKIKENPRRGIYIEGLIEIDIESPEELIDLLAYGDKQRTVAATRMNNYSSRSHSLFILEMIQKFPSEAEKRGRLNLVDLAGSEKVGKTGTSGETLEEAKKINLSLSCLGFVIYALTSSYDHIPYRDSKLTRILQESLGGNYKTTLIVACSPHSSNKEETLSTLKFAARAKTIKNKYKMNIQNSPESLVNAIEALKLELEECRAELAKYKEGGSIPQGITDVFARNWSKFRSASNIDEEAEAPSKLGDYMKMVQLDVFDPMKNLEKIREDLEKDKGQDNKESFEAANVAETLERKLNESQAKFEKRNYQSYSYYKTNLELITLNQTLENRLDMVTAEYYSAHREILQRDKKIKEQEDEILHLKNQLMNYEMKINKLTEDYGKVQLQLETKTDTSDNQKLTIEVLEKQIYAINEALNNTQASLEDILGQKSRLLVSKFNEFVNDDQQYKQIRLPEYFTHSYNFNFEPFYDKIPQSLEMNTEENDARNDDKEPVTTTAMSTRMGPIEGRLLSLETHPDKNQITEEAKGEDGEDKNSNSHSDNGSKHNRDSRMVEEDARIQQKNINKQSFIGNLDLQSAFANASNNLRELLEVPYTVYSLSNKLEEGIKEGSADGKGVSNEFMIYILKQQLLQMCIINQHLERTISALEWKQIIEYGKAKIKSNFMKMQERHIENLEKVLEKSRVSHEKLRNRVEAVELESIKLRENNLGVAATTSHFLEPFRSPKTSKARVMKPIRRDTRKPTITRSFTSQDGTPQASKHITNAVNLNPDLPESQELSTDNKKVQTPISHDVKVIDLVPFLKEIDEELQTIAADPESLEDAKTIISLKGNIISKMRNYIASTTSNSGPKASIVADAHENLIQYLKYEMSRLENKLMLTQTQFNVERARAEQLKEAWNEQRNQMAKLNHLNTELEIAGRNALKKENASWQKILDEITLIHKKEMQRKQEEVTNLHDLLARWTFKYMELQEAKHIQPTHPEKLLFETYKKKEVPKRMLLEKAITITKSTAQLNVSADKAGLKLGISTPKNEKFINLSRTDSPQFNYYSLEKDRSKKSLF